MKKLDAAATQASRDEVRHRIVTLKRMIRQGRPPAEGDILAERFILVRLIGSGGFAGVWLARDRAANFAPVAVKLLHLRHAYDQVSRVDRFFRGARIMARLQHPNVVRILVGAAQEPPASHFFVMEHLPGPNLLQALTLEPSLGLRMNWLHGLALALEYAHGNNVVHRDVKPQNVVLDGAGVAKLTDFDLTWASDTSGGTEAAPMGSLIYGAPEVLEGSGEVTPQCDVYSYAITMIAVLSGREPPGTIIRNAGDYLRRIRPPELSDKAIALLERSTSWEPSERPRSPLELYDELETEITRPQATVHAKEASNVAGRGVIDLQSANGVWTRLRGIEYVQVPQSSELGAGTAFWMSRTPITVAQFHSFVHNTGSESSAFFSDMPQLPVVGITWHQAVAFATWAHAVLPTTQQWEHALRTGLVLTIKHDTEYDKIMLDSHAWHAGNSEGRPQPCGQKAPTRWGLHDLLGNVWEWCNAPDTDTSANVCGGSYQSPVELLSEQFVSRSDKRNAQRDLGFRIISVANIATPKSR